MAPDAAGLGQRPLIARERELAELQGALDAADAGQGSLVLLTGEAGIGKTRLAHAFCGHAEARGALCLWGSCWEGEGAPAYWPWIQVVRALARTREDEALRAELGPGAAHLVRVVPELAERMPEVTPASDVFEHEHFAVFDALAQLLQRASASDRLVVVLDDLHWADRSSLLALTAVARSVPATTAVVVGTYRTVEARESEVGDLLADLRRFATLVPLRGLDARAVARLLAHHAEDLPADELAERLHELSGGNPFFVEELARLLIADPATNVRAGTPLPEGIRHVVRRRLDSVPADTREALRAAAVIGDRFRIATLGLALDLPPGDLVARLDPAISAELLHEQPEEAAAFRFAHALVREALVEELRPAARSALHAAIGEALVHRYGPDSEDHASEIALHFLEAVPAVDARAAVDHAAAAGARAVARFGYEEGAALYARALDALELAGGDDRRRLPLLLALGEARMLGGRAEEARATLRRAAAAARELGDTESLARAALSSTGWALPAGDVDEELVALLEEAIAGLETMADGAPALLARLKVQLAAAIYWTNADERRRALAQEAAAICGDRAEDAATRAYVAVKGLVVTWGPDSAERDLARTEEIIAACRETGDVALELQTRNWRINAFLELGDLTAVDQEMARVEHMAHVLRQPRALAFLPVHRALRALLEGHFEDARALLIEAGEWWSGSVGSSAGLVHETQVMVMHWLLRTLDEIEPLIHASVVALPGLVSRRCALLIAYCDAGRPAEARRELDLLGTQEFADLPRDNSWRATVALLAEGCARVRATHHATALRDLLTPYAHLHVIAPQGAYMGPVARPLALLDATLGDEDSARRQFTAAWSAAEGLGAHPVLVRLALEQAELLGDTERVPDARELAARLGMERMAAALGALESAPAAASEAPASARAALRREGEVWTLTYEGRSIRLNDARGLHHLARLLAHPGVEVHAIDLVAGPAAAAPAGGTAAASELAVRAGGGDAGALLDPQAKAAYRARLEELREEVDEAEAFNDPERASRAREEMEFIAHELAGAVGLGGRDRKAASDAERARVNATRAIRSIVKRIGEYDAGLARLLDTTVRTGTFCVYEPDPRHPVTWEIAVD